MRGNFYIFSVITLCMGAAIDLYLNSQTGYYESCTAVVLKGASHLRVVGIEDESLGLERFLPPAWYVCQQYKHVERITRVVE
jgi:hypothetical protein